MNDVSVRVRAEPALQVLAVWRVLPEALLLLGRASGPMPASGSVLAAPSARGAFRCLSWPVEPNDAGPHSGGHAFIAAIRLPERADPHAGAALTLHGASSGPLMFDMPPMSAPSAASDAVFGQQAARLAGRHAAVAARFLLDTLCPPGSGEANRDVPGLATMLRAFLSQAAKPDGHIEIMAVASEACVLLQGWGARIAGPVQVVLAGASLPCFAGHAGEFTRTDTDAPAVGVMLALPPAAAGALAGVDHVFILSDTGLHSRTVAEHKLLDPAASAGHIRHMLPTLRCAPPMQAMLLEALRARYDGRDTLAGNPHPVRAALDMATAAHGVGAYCSGWVFDPARILAALHLCGSDGLHVRLDTGWTRVPRPDVSAAFRETPGFPTPPDADAGFAVFTPTAPGPLEALHLQFTFTDGDRAFVPLPVADPADAVLRARLLAGIDLYKPSGLPIIERHAAPLLARVRPAPSPAPQVLLQGPTGRECAVVVPLPAPILPRAFLSGFLHEPADGLEQLVLACGPQWDAASLEALRGLVGFYGLPATILVMADAAGPATALRAAAQATQAGSFLVAGPGVAGRTPGWRHALRLAAGQAAFACPTLLYEDWSIRYAGAAAMSFQDSAPYAQVQAVRAGMPAGLSDVRPPIPAVMGTLECCLLRRAALAALDGEGALTTDAGLEAAFFLRLRASGTAGLWAPSIQVYAPEDPEPLQTRAASLADGWVLRDAWRGKGKG